MWYRSSSSSWPQDRAQYAAGTQRFTELIQNLLFWSQKKIICLRFNFSFMFLPSKVGPVNKGKQKLF
jgi:hypothetical protein